MEGSGETVRNSCGIVLLREETCISIGGFAMQIPTEEIVSDSTNYRCNHVLVDVKAQWG